MKTFGLKSVLVASCLEVRYYLISCVPYAVNIDTRCSQSRQWHRHNTCPGLTALGCGGRLDWLRVSVHAAGVVILVADRYLKLGLDDFYVARGFLVATDNGIWPPSRGHHGWNCRGIYWYVLHMPVMSFEPCADLREAGGIVSDYLGIGAAFKSACAVMLSSVLYAIVALPKLPLITNESSAESGSIFAKITKPFRSLLKTRVDSSNTRTYQRPLLALGVFYGVISVVKGMITL